MITLEEIQTYEGLYAYYLAEGFIFARRITSEERKKHDAKAHVFQEYAPEVEFKYVPLGGKHVFMFKTPPDRMKFDKYCGVLS